jgi:hypothetical protein
MTAQDLLTAIEKALASGKSVTFSTYLRATKVTPKTAKSWAGKGLTLFKIENDQLCIASGNRFESVMGCKITVA